jgi:hypothetical protein
MAVTLVAKDSDWRCRLASFSLPTFAVAHSFLLFSHQLTKVGSEYRSMVMQMLQS